MLLFISASMWLAGSSSAHEGMELGIYVGYFMLLFRSLSKAFSWELVCVLLMRSTAYSLENVTLKAHFGPKLDMSTHFLARLKSNYLTDVECL